MNLSLFAVDGDLIYEYIGDDFLYTTLINNFDELGIKISKASEIEMSNIKTMIMMIFGIKK
jgi:hypothetical protein